MMNAQAGSNRRGQRSRERVMAPSRLFIIAAAAIRRSLQAMGRSQCRRQSIRQLMAFDDATLADIGIRRSEIPSLVDELLQRRSGLIEGGAVAQHPSHIRIDRASVSDWRPIGTIERSRPV